ncbi:MAG: tRNA (adenosine(37)-N6)-threonylcarbamoyltransferase complex ATPase subunit type 1 TsaE, partial [Christiangramia sp.]|nr:tRNA (adenosine(37)-N6)-threonylcarbamoyltransferase complex ATPase subunit type 1 TsaE [Christiangramia sp.]
EGPVFHFDFYRIEDDTEALDIGIEDYLDSDGWNLIEWPEKVERLLGENTQKLLLEVESENTRKLKFC